MHNAMHVDIRKSHQIIYAITVSWIPAVDQELFLQPKETGVNKKDRACFPGANFWYMKKNKQSNSS